MGNVNPAYYDRVRYTLQHIVQGNQEITEPIGWREDDKEYARNKSYHGIFAKFSNSLEFIDDGKDFINTVRSVHGVNAEIRLLKDVKDDEEKWVRAYTGFLDMSTWSQENNRVSIKFNSGGLEKILKARRSDKIELERLTNLKGSAIDPLQIDRLELTGRRIFLDTRFNVLTSANEAKCSVETNAGNTRSDTVGIPLNMYSQSHDLANSVIPETDGSENNGSTGMMFYANNDRDRVFQIDLDLTLDAFFQQYENVQWCFYKISLTKYENGVNYDVKERIVLAELNSGFSSSDPNDLPDDVDFPYPQFTKEMHATFSGEVELLQDESLAIEAYLKSDMYFDNNAGVRCFAQNIDGWLTIEEDSYFQPSITNGIMAHEAFERMIEVITNATGNFYSEILGRTDIDYSEDGRAALSLLAHGHWIRNFNSGDELYKPFTTSFKQLFDAYHAAYNIGLGIEKIGFNEQIVVEDLKYFYNLNTTIRLGETNSDGVFEYIQVKKLKRYEAKDYYYSSVEIGSNKGGVYEEVMGLEETNTMSNFITAIEAVVKDYTKLSPYRHDTYGEEIIRRRTIDTHPNTDQSGDKDVWLHDVKRGPGGIYKTKSWEDVLVSEPIGMFSPETSYNFIYSPVSMLLQHGWVINAGLQQYPLEKIRFGSSKGKSEVVQHLIGGSALAENGDIPQSQLERARYKPEIIEFEYEVNDELIRTVEGYTVILGKKVLNLYGLIEFKNENSELEKGFLLSLKPNKEGKWKLLKANI